MAKSGTRCWCCWRSYWVSQPETWSLRSGSATTLSSNSTSTVPRIVGSLARPARMGVNGLPSIASCTGSSPVSRRSTWRSMSSCMRDAPTRISACDPSALARSRCCSHSASESITLGLKPRAASRTSMAATNAAKITSAPSKMRHQARCGRRWLELEVDEGTFIASRAEEQGHETQPQYRRLGHGSEPAELRFQ